MAGAGEDTEGNLGAGLVGEGWALATEQGAKGWRLERLMSLNSVYKDVAAGRISSGRDQKGPGDALAR